MIIGRPKDCLDAIEKTTGITAKNYVALDEGFCVSITSYQSLCQVISKLEGHRFGSFKLVDEESDTWSLIVEY